MGANCPCATDQPVLLFLVGNEKNSPQDLLPLRTSPTDPGTCLGGRLHEEKGFLELTKPHEDKPKMIIKNYGI